MNIDERCYGYEPATSQLRQLRRELAEAKEMLANPKRSILMEFPVAGWYQIDVDITGFDPPSVRQLSVTEGKR